LRASVHPVAADPGFAEGLADLGTVSRDFPFTGDPGERPRRGLTWRTSLCRASEATFTRGATRNGPLARFRGAHQTDPRYVPSPRRRGTARRAGLLSRDYREASRSCAGDRVVIRVSLAEIRDNSTHDYFTVRIARTRAPGIEPPSIVPDGAA